MRGQRRCCYSISFNLRSGLGLGLGVRVIVEFLENMFLHFFLI